MIKLRLKRQSSKRLKTALKNYVKDVVEPINKANTEAARDLIRTARKNLAANGTDDTGRLRASIVVLDRRQGGLFIDTGTNVNYAINIEEGQKPHQMSNDDFLNLMGWVGRKLGTPSNKRFITAVWIKDKIAEEGTKAQPFLLPAATEVRPRHKRAVIKEVRKYNKKVKK